MQEQEGQILTGTIRCRVPWFLAPEAVIHITVEDVSRLDAAAVAVAQLDIKASSMPFNACTEALAFRVSVPVVDTHRHYGARVHIAQAGQAKVQSGDYLSTTSYPVLTFDGPGHIDMTVTRI